MTKHNRNKRYRLNTLKKKMPKFIDYDLGPFNTKMWHFWCNVNLELTEDYEIHLSYRTNLMGKIAYIIISALFLLPLLLILYPFNREIYSLVEYKKHSSSILIDSRNDRVRKVNGEHVLYSELLKLF